MLLKDKEFYIYLAGFVDGEGCIGLRKDSSTKNVYRGKLHITNTNLMVLTYIKDKIGFGSLYINRKKGSYGNNKTTYVWEVCNRQCLKVLEKIKPYLLVKKEQAGLIIKFQKSVYRTNKKPNQKKVIIRNRIFNELKILNMRGIENHAAASGDFKKNY